MGKNQWVVRYGKQWAVRGEGNSRVSSVHDSQADAERAAIRKAKKEKSEVIVQGRDTKIRSKDSYGRDPNPPRDREH